jgi:hypothetical protein
MNIPFQSTGLDNDWYYGFEDDKYILKINPAEHTNLNFKEACMFLAGELHKNLKFPVISLSGGLDGQIVLNSFYDQNLKVDCVFRHYPGFNDIELEWVTALQKKYNFKLTKIVINPYEIREEILKEHQETKIFPGELMYKKFVSMLPEDMDIIQGYEGPIIAQGFGKLYYLESYNTFEFARRRAVALLNRKSKFITFGKNSNILASIFQEEPFQCFLDSYDYFAGHDLTRFLKDLLPDSWDLYIKPYLYYKHWKHDLMYFPKYQGSEKIHWLGDYRTYYRERMIVIEINTLRNHIFSQTSQYTNFTESKYSIKNFSKDLLSGFKSLSENI